MVERSSPDPTDDPLSLMLRASADPTRRAILTLLAQNGPTRVTEIAERFAQSLNAISRHIMVLERAGLVRRRTVWRSHMIEIDLAPLAQIDRWFAGLRSIWALRLDALAAALDTHPDIAPDMAPVMAPVMASDKETPHDPHRDARADDEPGAFPARPARPRL